MSTYYGSGVILIDIYNNIPCVILARNNLSNTYTDFVGKLKNNNLLLSAIEELNEETCNLFHIKQSDIINNYIDKQ